MKIALITDTHWGARGDSSTYKRFHKKQKERQNINDNENIR